MWVVDHLDEYTVWLFVTLHPKNNGKSDRYFQTVQMSPYEKQGQKSLVWKHLHTFLYSSEPK